MSNFAYRLLMTIIIVMLLATACVKPYLQMRTFNKFSERKATFLDAICGDLRVVPK